MEITEHCSNMIQFACISALCIYLVLTLWYILQGQKNANYNSLEDENNLDNHHLPLVKTACVIRSYFCTKVIEKRKTWWWR